MFVSHLDESGKGGPIFVVGGLISTPDKWLAFTDRWTTILHEAPRIEAFKFSHIPTSDGFTGKLPLLVEAINTFAERADLGIIHVDEYKSFFSGKMGVTFDNPFHVGYMHIIQQSALRISELNLPGSKIDFIFDYMDDTQYLELLYGFRAFKDQCPAEKVKSMLGRDPIRDHDENVIPLQAADLVTGAMRRAYEDGDATAKAVLSAIKIPNQAFLLDHDKWKELYNRSANRHPLFGKTYEPAKQRSLRLREPRKLLRLKDNL